MTPLTPTQQARIVSNIVTACRDITKLNEPAYKFIMNCSGFIAHYDRQGFVAHYSEPGSLKADSEANERFNQWRNFRAGEENADYYHSKRDTYNAILDRLQAGQFIRERVIFSFVGA